MLGARSRFWCERMAFDLIECEERSNQERAIARARGEKDTERFRGDRSPRRISCREALPALQYFFYSKRLHASPSPPPLNTRSALSQKLSNLNLSSFHLNA